MGSILVLQQSFHFSLIKNDEQLSHIVKQIENLSLPNSIHNKTIYPSFLNHEMWVNICLVQIYGAIY